MRVRHFSGCQIRRASGPPAQATTHVHRGGVRFFVVVVVVVDVVAVVTVVERALTSVPRDSEQSGSCYYHFFLSLSLSKKTRVRKLVLGKTPVVILYNDDESSHPNTQKNLRLERSTTTTPDRVAVDFSAKFPVRRIFNHSFNRVSSSPAIRIIYRYRTHAIAFKISSIDEPGGQKRRVYFFFDGFVRKMSHSLR